MGHTSPHRGVTVSRMIAVLLLTGLTAWAGPVAQAAPVAQVAPVAQAAPVACPPRTGGTGVQVDAAAPALPAVAASAWLVADVTTGEVLAACNAHLRLAPASTLKVLTALALVPGIDPDVRYTAAPADAAIEGSKVGLVAGSTYTRADLLHGLLLGSGNDAANALANLAGGQPAAAALMTAEAARLQAQDTVVVNTSGLDAAGQVSSAHDLALFGREAVGQPWLAEVAATTRYDFPADGTTEGSARRRFEIQNHNRLLRNVTGATGLKNGYTVAAGGSYIGTATRGERSVVVTVLNAEGSTWRMAQALLEWAFAAGDAAPVGSLPEPLPAVGSASQSPSPAAPSTVSPTPAPTVPAEEAVTLGAVASGSSVPWPVTVVVLLVVVLAGFALGTRRTRSRHSLR